MPPTATRAPRASRACCCTHLGPGLTNAATGVANAALDSIPMVVIAGDVPVLLLRPPSAPGGQPAPGRRSVPDLPAVLQARLPRGPRRGPAAHRWSARSICAQTGRPGPVLVDVPMDIFSADLPVDAFSQHAAADRRRPGSTPATAERIVAGARRGRAAAALRRRRRAVGAGHRGAGGAGRGARGAGRAHPDGQGMPARRPSAAARADRVLGHAHRQRQVPHRRPDRGRRHAAGRSELELVGSAVHVRDSADAPDPHRRGRGGDRPQLPDRARRRRRRQAGAGGAGRGGARPAAPPTAARCARRSPAAARSSPPTGREQWASDQFPLRPERILSELRKAVPEDGFIVTDVGWNKNGVGQQFPITVPGTFITPSGLATMGFGAAAVLGVKVRAAAIGPPSRSSATAASAPPTRPWWPRRWRPA